MSGNTDGDTLAYQAPQLYVDTIIGPVVAGWGASLILFGALAVQYFYYVTGELYRQDSRATKAILHVVVLLAFAQTVNSYWLIAHYATSQGRDSATLFDQTIADCMSLSFVGVEGALVQIFFAHRAVGLLGRNRYKYVFCFFLMAGVITALSGAFGYLAASILMRADSPIDLFEYAVAAWLWGSTYTDVVITATFCVLLRKKMAHFSHQTDSILQRLVKLAIISAAPTALMTLTGAILGSIFPLSSLYTNITGAFWGPMPGLYGMGMIANLNGRRAVREVHSQAVYKASVPVDSLLASGSTAQPISPVMRVDFPQQQADRAQGAEKDKHELRV